MKDLSEVARDIINDHPNIGRYDLADRLGVSEWQARELLRKTKSEPIGPRIAYFDLETTALIGDLATILCGSILSYPSMEMTSYRLDQTKHEDMTDDSEISRLIRDKLEDHHILIGWYSKGFDVSLLNTRLVRNGHRKMATHLHYDPCFAYRGWHGLKPRASKLDTVAEFYDLDERKQKVDIQVWRKAAVGNKAAMDELVERCESDVRILAKITEKTFDAGIVKNITRFA